MVVAGIILATAVSIGLSTPQHQAYSRPDQNRSTRVCNGEGQSTAAHNFGKEHGKAVSEEAPH
jgi:hypothetical protein